MLLWIRCEDRIIDSIFGLNLIERHWLAAKKAKLAITAVILSCPSDDVSRNLRSYCRHITVPVQIDTSPVGDSLRNAISQAGDTGILVSSADTLADGRLYHHSNSGKDFVAKDRGGYLAVLHHQEIIDGSAATVEQALSALPQLLQEEFGSFIPKLRRSLPFYLFKIEKDEDRRMVERFLFWSNYKGSTDLFTAYVYPPLVWLLLRPLAKARIHPNIVTWVSIFLTFLAVPLFAEGFFTWGFLCAYGMSVLDSVDGKLARLTFADSAWGNILDHGLDLIHPPLWYMAWAWGLAHGDYHSHLVMASLIMTGLYIFDRLILKIYPTIFRRGLHTHGKLDVVARSIISRRNINLPLFTAGYYLGLGEPVFILIVLWQAATCLYHGIRTAYILIFDRKVSLL